MKLDFEQIKSITQGASYVDGQDGLINFHRFTPAEEAVYINTQFEGRAFSSASIQLVFTTDGDRLNLSFETSATCSRTYFSVDIFVNGILCKHIQNFGENTLEENYTLTPHPLGAFSEEAELGKGNKTVRIVLPWSVRLQLREMEVENATYITPVPKNKKLIMYGDSITHGYDAVYPSNAYANRFADALGAELYNKAIGGEIFNPKLAACKNDICPDYITVAYGTNDWSTTEQDDFILRCTEFFRLLAQNNPDSAIYAITPIWRKDHVEERKFGDIADVEKSIRQICAQYANIRVIRGWELVPQDKAYYADQRLHPNDRGFAHYFENLKKEFDKLQ